MQSKQQHEVKRNIKNKTKDEQNSSKGSSLQLNLNFSYCFLTPELDVTIQTNIFIIFRISTYKPFTANLTPGHVTTLLKMSTT